MSIARGRLVVLVSRYARGRKGRLTLGGFSEATGVPRGAVKEFGGFYGLLRAAGLGGRVARRYRIPPGELLAEYDRLQRTLKRPVRWADVKARSRFAEGTFYRAFRHTAGLRAAYEEWKRHRGRSAQTCVGGRGVGWGGPRVVGEKEGVGGCGAGIARGLKLALKGGEFPCGAPLCFRGLVHEPTCEAGVIHIFGLLGPELGFAIIGIRAGFPDCLALRPSKENPDRWEAVRIEFEFRSSNFKEHGHDARKCDLIVCWVDDWPGSPVPVLELKSELQRVRAAQAAV